MTEQLFKKDIHYSQDIEVAIIGACLLESDAFSRTYGLVNADQFYCSPCRELYKAMQEMYDKNMPIDMLTVTDYMVRLRGFENFYGYSVGQFVLQSTNHVCSTAHLEYRCKIIQQMWIDRELIRLTYSGPGKGNHREQITALQNRLTELTTNQGEKDWYDMVDLMIELYNHRQRMQTQGPGILSGIKKMDQVNGGFVNGDMIVIGARPSVGKSAFLGLLALNMARAGKKVGIISLEMNNAKIAGRLASLDIDIDFATIYRGLIKDEQWQEQMYYQLANQTANLPIYVSDKTQVSVPEIKAKSMKLKRQHGCDILFIDYLQLVDSSTNTGRNANRENEVRMMSRGCKLMAKELGLPVVVLAQLNRESTARKGDQRYPVLPDLRESGSIEQDADVVMFLHRDWLAGYETDENGESTERQADLIVRKWRDGEANLKIPLGFDGPKMRFFERETFAPKQNIGPIRMPYNEKDDNPF